MNPKYTEWRVGDENYLKAHYGKIPAKEIAVKLGRSLAAINAKAHMLSLKGIKIKPKIDMKELEELCNFGYSSNDIGRIMQVSGSTVRRTVRNHAMYLYRTMIANGKQRQRIANRPKTRGY